jgi:hypothetical protein
LTLEHPCFALDGNFLPRSWPVGEKERKVIELGRRGERLSWHRRVAAGHRKSAGRANGRMGTLLVARKTHVCFLANVFATKLVNKTLTKR